MGQVKKYSIIDIETTGGNARGNRITEIAIINFDGEKVEKTYSTLINPEQRISYWITKLTGITNDMVADAPKFYQVAKKIIEMTEGRVFVAHNVRFDYEFIRKEFSDLGYSFFREKLCTVRQARQYIPGHKSYSLGNICQDLGIEIRGRHRALGDAEATVKLLQLIFKNGGKDSEESLSKTLLPPHLDIDEFNSLPEICGVYYFYDKAGKLLYVGKSKNIRKRVHSHLSTDYKATKSIQFKNSIAKIETCETGSELMALVKECEEIKNLQPPFNRASKKTKYPFGIYWNDERPHLVVKKEVSEMERALILFSSKRAAEKKADALIKTYMLGIDLDRSLLKTVKGELTQKYNYPHSRLILWDKGRRKGELSYFLVDDNEFIGHGYWFKEEGEPLWEKLYLSMFAHAENRDSRQILLSFLQKAKEKRSRKLKDAEENKHFNLH